MDCCCVGYDTFPRGGLSGQFGQNVKSCDDIIRGRCSVFVRNLQLVNVPHDCQAFWKRVRTQAGNRGGGAQKFSKSMKWRNVRRPKGTIRIVYVEDQVKGRGRGGLGLLDAYRQWIGSGLKRRAAKITKNSQQAAGKQSEGQKGVSHNGYSLVQYCVGTVFFPGGVAVGSEAA